MLLGIYLGNNLAEEQEYKGEYDGLKYKAKYAVDAKIEEKGYEIVDESTMPMLTILLPIRMVARSFSEFSSRARSFWSWGAFDSRMR